ncbi:MarR family transcriptional regulator [uncultured Tenacibaculum sp.]|uniref:MarR family winged helix-turn-helix transcriptional regulator n=1 Tax=uncultured Tenacibaculum sp. TaxID=174713 RepID=UPI00262728E0|nr:MarR family transcriptional regulator [uncultured Tenacibaculum sp.]
MEKDFLTTLDYSGIIARVKRFSDSIIYDVRKIYDNSEFDIEPNWHLYFLLLEKEHRLTVTEIADKLKFSHPAVIKVIKKMEEKGYVLISTDKKDSRRKLIELSQKSKEMFPAFKLQWKKIKDIVNEIVDENFLLQFSQIEKNLDERNFFERFNDDKKLKNNKIQ